MKEIRLKVTGKVQGVFYRDTIRCKAEELKLTGFARNEEDGSVTVVAQGPENDLIRLLEAAWQGSSSSQVTNVAEQWHEPQETMSGFQVL